MADDETKSFFVLGPGSMVHHYRIVERIGAGGMGEVFLAEDTKLNRKVALKFLPAMYAHNAEFKQRLLREARAAAAIDHPNVCAIYEVSEWKGFTFLAMPYLKGRTVRQHVGDGSLTLGDTLSVLIQTADGLRAAHREGVIHRDIKSSNIMLSDDGRVSIMDFGLAKSAAEGDLTRDGATMGTVAYMSPEQVSGGRIDKQTDIWSLGVVAYEMLTGELIFKRDSDHATFNAIVSDSPPPVASKTADIPEGLEKIVGRCLAKDKNQRYRSADELLADLERLASEDNTRSLSHIRPLTGSRVSSGSGGSSLRPASTIAHRRPTMVTSAWIVMSFIAVFAVDWISESRGLAPALVEFVTVLLFGLLPAVMIGGYALSNRHAASLKRWSLPIVVANLAIVAVLLGTFYGTEELGAVSTEVSIETAEGETITRLIPKGAFRKNVALFFLENVSGDTAHTWQEMAFTLLMRYDLMQDPYFDIVPAFNFLDEIRQAGFDELSGLPLTLERKIAENENLRYFHTGAFDIVGDTIIVRPRLYETSSGELIAQHELRMTDLYAIVDSMSVLLRNDLEVPRDPDLQIRDLPVAEMTTTSLPALRALVDGEYEVMLENDWEGALEHLQRAIELDSTFVLAYSEMQLVMAFANRPQEQAEVLRKAMQYIYKLPERMQFQIRYRFLYTVQQDGDGALAVLQNWSKLYPEDIDARIGLGALYQYRNEPEQAIEQFKMVLRIDPGRTDFIRNVGRLYRNEGMIDSAVTYFSRYREAEPNRPDAYLTLGDLYRTTGRFDEAGAEYSRALSMVPENVEAMLKMAQLYVVTGRFDEAVDQFDDAEQLSRTPDQFEDVYRARAAYASLRGRMDEFFELTERQLEESAKTSPPLLTLFERMETLDRLVDVQQADSALAVLDQLTSQLPPPTDKFAASGRVHVFAAIRDTAALKNAIPEVREVIDLYGIRLMEASILRAEGIIAEERGNYDKAIGRYQHLLEFDPLSLQTMRDLARAYRSAGAYTEAENYLTDALKMHPNAPRTHLEAARLAVARNRYVDAQRHLNLALDIWRDADPDYLPAIEARELARTIDEHTTP